MELPITDLTPFAKNLPHHIHLSADLWTIAKFRIDDFNPRRQYIIDEFEKWITEFREKPNTTFKPSQIEVRNNVLTLTGLTESAKRDTAETSTTIRYMGIGTGDTAESESQSALVAEDSGGSYARKDLSSAGQRKVVNQTAKYGVAWDDGDVSAVPITLNEAGLFTASSSGIMHARVLHSDFAMASGDLFVVQLNELHANGSS